jgi:energy-coupling factor transporter ATP-binding protein EcfA2
MKGRYLIAFYGTTGSGKSTSVNYFLRLPLQYKEDSGKRIVQIDEENLKQRDQIRKNDCKIGHSAVLSETLYSRGYCIPLEELEEDEEYLKTVVLCDHPGFGDTRGSQYEICANLSMDRTIEVCKALRAIVLVVPFDSITADRSSKFI